jgi:hypothetical protein
MKRRATGNLLYFDLAWKSGVLALGAQQVIALRLAKIAAGGPQAAREASLMLTEKVAALSAGQRLMLKACAKGDAGGGVQDILRLYQRRVSANARRLGRG